MEKSTIALIIMALSLVLYATEKLPLAVTALLSALAMAFTGCISFSEAFAGFSNTATLMVIGLCIIGEAFFTTGLADRISSGFLRMKHLTEARFVLVAALVGAVLSMFLNALIVMALFMPIVDALAAKTDGKITRKNTYLPIGIGAVFGGNLSVIGSTSMINASGLLAESAYGKPLDFFAPTIMGGAGVVLMALVMILSGTKLQQRFFTFDDVISELPELSKAQMEEMRLSGKQPVWKQWFVLAVLLGCIVCYVLGLHYGAVSILGACLVIAVGCIDMKHAIRGVSWDTVFVVAGTLGFAKGMDVSGAGQVIADFIIRLAGPLSTSGYVMALLMLLIGTILSNFMSNNATVGILVPVSVPIAMTLGCSPVPFALACAIGANLSVMTPICTATITMTACAGYRFKDYVKYGGIFNLLALIGTALVMWIVYF